MKKTKKKYRVRPGSPLWWAEGIFVTVLVIANIYLWMGIGAYY